MGEHGHWLASCGYDVTIVAGRGASLPGARGLRTVRIAEANSRGAVIERDRDALARGERPRDHDARVERLVRKLRPFVEKSDRVVVHNVMTMPFNLALTAAIARLAATTSGKVIAWTHDIAAFDPRYAAFEHPGAPWDLIRTALPGVRYVTVSSLRADQLSELTGLPRDRISVVTNGIDVARVLGLSRGGAHLAEKLGIYDADPLLLLPVRITRRKRIEAAIDATRILRERGRDAMLVVTGGVGPHDASNRAYLAELAARASKVDGVKLLAALGISANYDQIVDLFALSDVLVFPSESEGFGLPMLEAGLHRMPIVCSDIPALRETGGDEPIYVPPDASGEVIADAVLRAIANPVMAMRRRARAHSWRRVVRERVLPVIVENKP
jgi:glycosyltransferase involved in cell wall biosynthesis